MILMTSVQNLEEALEALRGGADIIDVKNLQEALVGSAHPNVVGDVRRAIPDDIHAVSLLAWSQTRSGLSPWLPMQPARSTQPP